MNGEYETYSTVYEASIPRAEFDSRARQRNDYIENTSIRNTPDSPRNSMKLLTIAVAILAALILSSLAVSLSCMLSILQLNHQTPLQNMSLAVAETADSVLRQLSNETLFTITQMANSQRTELKGISNKLAIVVGSSTTQEKKYEVILKSINAIKQSCSAVRLVNGSNRYSGRVEILYQGNWGTVCDDGWDLNDANVICRMLGFSGARSALSNARYGQGPGLIVLDYVRCTGMEESIWDCTARPWGTHFCAHSEDASVVCRI